MIGFFGLAYLIFGVLFALWAGTGFEDRSQFVLVAPWCVMLWPLFVVGIAVTYTYYELSDAIKDRR